MFNRPGSLRETLETCIDGVFSIWWWVYIKICHPANARHEGYISKAARFFPLLTDTPGLFPEFPEHSGIDTH